MTQCSQECACQHLRDIKRAAVPGTIFLAVRTSPHRRAGLSSARGIRPSQINRIEREIVRRPSPGGHSANRIRAERNVLHDRCLARHPQPRSAAPTLAVLAGRFGVGDKDKSRRLSRSHRKTDHHGRFASMGGSFPSCIPRSLPIISRPTPGPNVRSLRVI